MEVYIYYTIIFFSAVILSLYTYIIFKKINEKRKKAKRDACLKDTSAIIEGLISKAEEGYTNEDPASVKEIVFNSIKREIAEEKLREHIEKSSGQARNNLIKLCEDSGIIDYETSNLRGRSNFKAALACKILGELRSRKPLSEIEKLVDSSNEDIKYNALMALAKIGDNDAFEKAFLRVNDGYALSERSLTEIVDTFEGDKLCVYKKMMNSKNSFIASIFIKSAGNYMDSSIIENIAAFLKDGDKNRRIAAIKAIGQISDRRYLNEIAEALNDEDWEIRAVAARSLGQLNDTRAFDYLIKSLCDREWWVRYNSAYSIVGLPGGFEIVKTVLNGSDKFAKEILVSAIENSGMLNDIYKENNASNSEGKEIFDMIRKFEMDRE